MTLATSNHGSRKKAVWGARVRLAAAAAMVMASASCGEVVRQGDGSSYLIVRTFEAASGAEPNEFGGTLRSDVLTVVDDVPSIFNDIAEVTFGLGMKDPGGVGVPTVPSPSNFITINRYRVTFSRSDGRNTPGVDVPHPFEGAFTLTVGDSDATAGFTIVRHIAKLEAPLAALATNGVLISTIAEVTFFGQDLTGHAVEAKARILIDFGNFGDPE